MPVEEGYSQSALVRYTAEMHEYTFRLWSEVRKQVEEKAKAVELEDKASHSAMKGRSADALPAAA